MVPVEESLGGADYRDAHAGVYGAPAGGPSFQADLPMRLGDLLTHMQQGGQLPSSRYVAGIVPLPFDGLRQEITRCYTLA